MVSTPEGEPTEAQKTEPMVALGKPGDPCADCGAPLDSDQRYCLNCGRRRGEPRVSPQELHAVSPATAGAPVAPYGERSAVAAPREASPLIAVLGIAILGAMLLVGVLIGRGDGQTTTTAPPSVVRVGETQGIGSEDGGGAATTKRSESDGSAKPVKGDDKSEPKQRPGGLTKAGAGAGDGAAPVQATSEDLEALDNQSGEAYEEASENLPDTIQTPGEPPPVDNEQPGGGTDAQVIE